MKNRTVFSPFLGPFKDRSDRRGTVLFRNASQAGNSHVALIDVSKYPADERFEVPAALQNRLTVSKQRQVTRRNK